MSDCRGHADLTPGCTECALDEARAARDHFKEQLRERAEALLDARAEVERLREGVECHIARPGEGTYECSIERKCPACRLRHAEAEVERLRTERTTLLCGEGCSLTGILDGQDGVSRCAEHDKRLQTALRTVAERQRAACANRMRASVDSDSLAQYLAGETFATPLVTEEKP